MTDHSRIFEARQRGNIISRWVRRVLAPATAADCIFGKCGCRSAAVCKFKRCGNCDWPINANGRTLVDHSCEDWDICPECGGPLNERRVYGAL